jgi:uncharacterized protein YebE (UPF0316 family)
MLKLSNFQYQQTIQAQAAEVLTSKSSIISGTSEKEALIKGFITVTPFKGKGFEIDLPKILRSLKRRFR